MRNASRLRVAAASLTVFATLAGGSALAYFSATGEGIAPAGVSNLAKPTISSATPAVGGTVTVTWGAVSAPSTGTVTYYVTRDGGTPAGTCPTSAVPAEVTTCVDKGLEPGTHTYVVTAVWRSWTSNSAPATPKVTVGVATQLNLSAASMTPTAGVADNLTITAQDSAGSTVTTYIGSHSLTFSGASASPGGTLPTVANSSGTATAFGTATAINFSNGVATVSSAKNGVMKLYRAGAVEVAVTDGTISDPGLALTVSTAALSKFVLLPETTTPAAGAEDDLTITAQDTYANTITSYTGTHELTFSGASASPNGTAPTVSDSTGEPTAFATPTAIEFVAGVATESEGANGEMHLYKSGATSVKVTEGSISSATVTVTVAAGAAVRLALSASSLTPTAGASDNLTTTAQDIYGNAATSYAGTHELTFSGAVASPSGTAPTVSDSAGAATPFGTPTAINFSNGVATVSSAKNGVMKLYGAEPTTITVSDGTLSNTPALALTVSTAALSKFVLLPETTTPAAGAEDDLTITAQDKYANTITSYAGTHELTFSGASASPNGTAPTVSDSTGEPTAFATPTAIEFVAGVATESEGANGEMRLYKSGATSVKVTEGSISSATVVTTVAAGAAVKFMLGASTLTPAAGGSVNLTTTAQDVYGNTAITYAGAHSVTFAGASASPGGTLPTVVDSVGTVVGFGGATALNFTNGVAAVGSSKNGLMRLYRAGATVIVVTDGSISNGAGLTVTVSPTTASRFVFTNVKASAGNIGSPCLATCAVTSLGNGGTVQANVAVADTYGNTVSALGTEHTAAVTTSGGVVTGGSLAIPTTGPAESATQFTFTAQSSGAFTDTIKAAASVGTAYTNATITATR